MPIRRKLLAVWLLLGSAAGVALADPPADLGCDHARAGCPRQISPLAMPTNTPANCGGYVGGGCAFPRLADDRSPEEGTWGRDYVGWIIPRRVFLGWWHGRSYQGGTGAYRTDGPKLKDCHEKSGH